MTETGSRWKLVRWAQQGAPYTGATMSVLAALAIRANEDGYSWPSLELLQADTRCGRRTVQYALRTLERDGWVTIRRQRGPGGANLYRLDPEHLERRWRERPRRGAKAATPVAPEPPLAACGKDVKNCGNPVEKQRKSCDFPVFREVQGVQNPHPRGATIAPKGIKKVSEIQKTKAKADGGGAYPQRAYAQARAP